MGKNVFACSKWKYGVERHKNAFYVLYDEDNKLVCDGIIYGTISEKGLVDEWEHKRNWVSPQSQVSFEPVAPKAKPQKTVPATAYSAMVAGVSGSGGVVNTEDFFVRLDKEINELLATPFDAGDMSWAQ